MDDAGVSPILARLLALRGVGDADAARRFLAPDLERDWSVPSEIPGMDACADALADAVRAGRDIVVFGDFDVDGLTAAAVLARTLGDLGATVRATVPHRFREGYGLSEASVARLVGMRPDLVVTVDCGISSAAEVRDLQAQGIEVVVTDHHEPGGSVPEGVPVADPKLPGACFEGLAGAGVALKLAQAVGERLGSPDAWLEYADLAAIGTIGDIVPLIADNRALVAHGLERMRRDPRPAIIELAAVAGLEPAAMTSEGVAYGLSPRINAAGRLAEPAEALELLMTDDVTTARRVAEALGSYNTLRRDAEADLSDEAFAAAEERFVPGARLLLLSGEDWHEGVRGIVASRVAGGFGVPTLLLTLDGDEARGSGRSVPGVDLHAAVSACSEHLVRFGGHAAAVGVTLRRDALDAFGAALTAELGRLPAELFRPRLSIDAEAALTDLDIELAAEIAALEPFGCDNPRPMLAVRGVFMSERRRVGDGSHLKFDAYDGLASVPAIAFRMRDIDRADGHDEAVDLAFTFDAEEWRGRARAQIKVREVVYHDAAEAGATAELVGELFADAERIIARTEYENITDAESFHTKLAGVTFEGRQDVVARLEPGEPLRLVRQPDNEYDPNACALFDPRGAQVGFFNRRLAEALAPAIDTGAAYDVTVTDVTGGDGDKGLGVNVLVSRGPTDAAEEATAEGATRRGELAGLEAAALDDALRIELLGERELHEAQREALEHLGAGRSTLAVMATGRGKSLIFHLHAARTALAGGASVFVYPLRALVSDQAFHLTDVYGAMGLRVEVLTGETALGARDEAFAALGDGGIDAVMTTPEFLERNAHRFAEAGCVRFLVVDEAHHVGLARAAHRPAYTRLGEALDALGRPTVLAVTATAGPDVAAVIRETLGIEAVVADPTVRDNLRIEDSRGTDGKQARVVALAAHGEKTIVYVNSREQSVKVAEAIRAGAPGLRNACAFYNAGMNRATRHAVERAFREGEIRAVVATSAFGEGVNIPDVRHVVLYHLPFHRVEFNQMCGRSGRDGAEATVHLLFGKKDARLNELILEASAPDVDDLRVLYSVLRDHARDAGADGLEITNAELADAVKRRRKGARLSEKGASAGIGVFRELGLVRGEGAGGYRRLWLEPAPEGKLDITSSVRYAEGLREAAEFAEFRSWVLSAPAEELLAAFDRPILPEV